MALTPEFVKVLKSAMQQGGLTLDELLAAIREEMGDEEPEVTAALSAENTDVLRSHGIDEEEYRALNMKDGGKAYRALKARRAAASDDSGRAA